MTLRGRNFGRFRGVLKVGEVAQLHFWKTLGWVIIHPKNLCSTPNSRKVIPDTNNMATNCNAKHFRFPWPFHFDDCDTKSDFSWVCSMVGFMGKKRNLDFLTFFSLLMTLHIVILTIWNLCYYLAKYVYKIIFSKVVGNQTL